MFPTEVLKELVEDIIKWLDEDCLMFGRRSFASLFHTPPEPWPVLMPLVLATLQPRAGSRTIAPTFLRNPENMADKMSNQSSALSCGHVGCPLIPCHRS